MSKSLAAINAELQAVPWKLPRKRAFQSEHVLQMACADFLDRALPPDAFWTSIDSAGRGARDGARMKRRGVRKGVPDVLVMWRDKTLWIELKSAKGRWPVHQVKFSIAANAAGHRYRLCRSLIEVQEAAEHFEIPLRARLT